MEINRFLLGLIAVFLLSFYVNGRWPIPVLSVFNRWIRWILFSFSIAYLVRVLGWTEKPFWLLVLIGFMGWFLLETMYTWLGVRVLSYSTMPLFPLFTANHSGGDWPNRPHFVKTREWLRDHGFKARQSLSSKIYNSIEIRSSVYDDSSGKIRFQILFMPQRRCPVAVYYIFSSRTTSGKLFITDNIQMPFGGFYPENWFLQRKPLIRSLPRLLKKHQKRMLNTNEPFETWEGEPLDDVNQRQRILEQANTRHGFLFPHHLQQTCGRITREGRYRIWKEIWLLKYFGKTIRP